MTHHTPWQVVKRGTQVIATCDRRSPLTGKDVVMAECQSYDDAAFIARACNAHNDLLEALQECVNELTHGLAGTNERKRQFCAMAANQARAAIAKAKGE